MKHSQNLVGACLSAALLVACGGGNVPSSPTPTSVGPIHTPHHKKKTKTFNYTGGEQTFQVPTGETKVTITAYGASGETNYASNSGSYGPGGLGGLVKATIPVTPGETLAVFVGGAGVYYGSGFNGGAYGGGGASDVRAGGTGLENRVVVAGGGGGEGYGVTYGGKGRLYDPGGAGGSGGGTTGSAGGSGGGLGGAGGGGGSQSQGGGGGGGGVGSGRGSCNGEAGDQGTLGNGGSGASGKCDGPGAGGGGGYYGGGGGGEGGYSGSSTSYGLGYYGGGGGGGGGSSFIEKGAKHVENLQGAAPVGNGQIIISW